MALNPDDARLLQQALRDIARLLRWVRNFNLSGPFVTGGNGPEGATYVVGARRRPGPPRRPPEEMVTVKLDTSITVGQYNGWQTGPRAFDWVDTVLSGPLTKGALSATNEAPTDAYTAIIWDPNQADSDLAARSLKGLVASGRIIGREAASPNRIFVLIEGSSIQRMRVNPSNGNLEAAYVPNPESDQWVALIGSEPACEPPAE